jgi:hypothetical protein
MHAKYRGTHLFKIETEIKTEKVKNYYILQEAHRLSSYLIKVE